MFRKPGTILVALMLIVMGMGSIVWKQSLSQGDWFSPYLGEISSALLAGGLLSILYKVFTEREQREELRQLFQIHKSVEEAGLDEVLAASQSVNFTNFLEHNTVLSIVMNDGERWVGSHAVALRDRFCKKGTVTRVFTVSPEARFLSALAAKVGKSEEDQKQKIRNTWKVLQSEWNASTKAGNLNIFALHNYPTHSIFLGETDAIVTLYQASSGRAHVPAFVVKDVGRERSFFSFLKRDVAQLEQEARQVDIATLQLS